MKHFLAITVVTLALWPAGSLYAQDDETPVAEAPADPGSAAADPAPNGAVPSTSDAPAEVSSGDPAEDGVGGGAAASGEIDPLFEIQVAVQGPPVRAPIAIVDLTDIGTGGSADGAPDKLVEVIRHDLEISGLFEVTAPSTYRSLVDLKRDGVTVSTIDFDSWWTVGPALLVKGTYAVTGDQMEVDLRLFSVQEGRRIELNWSPTIAKSGHYRTVAHDFVNALIEYYTGERGVFGTRIVFAAAGGGRDRRLYSIDNAGYGLDRLDVAEAINVLPAWGPAGTILYTALTDDGDNIQLFKPADGETTQLTDAVGYATGASYCSSAKAIAFTLNNEEGTDIYTMNIDGTELTNLTNTPDIIETSPSWAPGCNRLAYVSDESARPQIYVMGADGADKRRLTWVGNYNTTPDWSPKGDLVAFTARDERRRFDIFTINVESGEIVRLTQDQGNNEEPTFSPDGRYLAFQSTRDGRQSRLYMMTADGRWQVRISDIAGVRTPDWNR